MVKDIQQLAGLLNFMTRAIHPGRPFLRRMYTKFSHLVDRNGAPIRNAILKQHHHICIDGEFKADCKIWEQFLRSQEIFARPMVDFEDFQNNAELIDFYTDAS